MSQSSPTAELSQADRLEWEDIEEIARELFHIWVSGGDLEWAERAWQALARARMTAYTSETERTICVVRLIALSALYQEFCVRAFDEGSSGEWQELVTSDLVGGYPKLDASALGQLTDRLQIDVDNPPLYESDPSEFTFVILELVRAEYRSVVDALMEQWGENAFFTSLWVSREFQDGQDDDGDEDEEDAARSPVTGDQIDHIMNYDIRGGKGDAHVWFTDGLPL